MIKASRVRRNLSGNAKAGTALRAENNEQESQQDTDDDVGDFHGVVLNGRSDISITKAGRSLVIHGLVSASGMDRSKQNKSGQRPRLFRPDAGQDPARGGVSNPVGFLARLHERPHTTATLGNPARFSYSGCSSEREFALTSGGQNE